MSTEKYWQLATYKELVDKKQLEWRAFIIKRDGFKCQACEKVLPAPKLDVCHITPKSAFFEVRGHLEDISMSYREDNLISMCRFCHKVQHGQRDYDWDGYMMSGAHLKNKLYNTHESIKKATNELDNGPFRVGWLKDNRSNDEILDFFESSVRLERHEFHARKNARMLKTRIYDIFESNIKTRGWRYAYEVVLVPPPPPLTGTSSYIPLVPGSTTTAALSQSNPISWTISGSTQSVTGTNLTTTSYSSAKPPSPPFDPSAFKELFDAGYVPSRRCKIPRNDVFTRTYQRALVCIMCDTETQCQGNRKACNECGIYYCDFHFKEHHLE